MNTTNTQTSRGRRRVPLWRKKKGANEASASARPHARGRDAVARRQAREGLRGHHARPVAPALRRRPLRRGVHQRLPPRGARALHQRLHHPHARARAGSAPRLPDPELLRGPRARSTSRSTIPVTRPSPPTSVCASCASSRRAAALGGHEGSHPVRLHQLLRRGPGSLPRQLQRLRGRAPRDTQFVASAEVSAKDRTAAGRRRATTPSSRFFEDLPDATTLGRGAAERALGRLGSKKGASARADHGGRTTGPRAGSCRMLLGRHVGRLAPAEALVPRRQARPARWPARYLTLTDDPHVKRGLGSRLFDGEGIAAKRCRSSRTASCSTYYVDSLLRAQAQGGRRRRAPPPTWPGSPARRIRGAARDLKEGILVTGFLGGNSNAATGDYSLGVQGFRMRDGKLRRAHPEMNISRQPARRSGSGSSPSANDPYAYSAMRTPTLVFDGVQFAGA